MGSVEASLYTLWRILHIIIVLAKIKDPCFELIKFTVLEELCFIRRLCCLLRLLLWRFLCNFIDMFFQDFMAWSVEAVKNMKNRGQFCGGIPVVNLRSVMH